MLYSLYFTWTYQNLFTGNVYLNSHVANLWTIFFWRAKNFCYL